jgi:PAS domain S-box-containing protein
VYSKDLEARTTSWNRSAERIYGYSAAEAIGRHVSMLVPNDHEREEMRILDRITQGERIETYETERIRKNGVRIDVSLTVSPIESSEGEIVGASVVARDVTTAKRQRKGLAFLAEASAKLEALVNPRAAAHAMPIPQSPSSRSCAWWTFVGPTGSWGTRSSPPKSLRSAGSWKQSGRGLR